MHTIGKKAEHVEAIVYRNENHATLRIRRAVELHLIYAAARETSAVNKHDHGTVFGVVGRMNVKDKAIFAVSKLFSFPELLIIKSVFFVPERAHLRTAYALFCRVEITAERPDFGGHFKASGCCVFYTSEPQSVRCNFADNVAARRCYRFSLHLQSSLTYSSKTRRSYTDSAKNQALRRRSEPRIFRLFRVCS